MPRKFDFISPGVSITEVDQSIIPNEPTDDGILIIGYAPQGPANKPIKVKNLDDFTRTFGNPISGKGTTSTDVWRDGNSQLTTYGMYAAQAWLASQTSPVTFVRLLGDDQVASKQAAGYVQAGWSSGQAHSKVPSSVATAYGLFIVPSSSLQTTAAGGTLAAVIYASGSAVTLRGTVAGQPTTNTVTSSAGTLIQSISTGGKMNTFELEIWDSPSASRKYKIHFDRTQKDGYIRNVLNCNPQKLNSINFTNTEKYFLGQTFEEAAERVMVDAGSSSAGQQYGVLLPLTDGTTSFSNNYRQSTCPKSGWVINRNPSPSASYDTYDAGTADKLFRLVSLHEGEWFQQNYGVRIEALRLGSTANPISSFSVVVVDAEGAEVERFDGLNMDESNTNFIGKRIGDQYQEYNANLKKFQLYGEYANRSDYIRVEMAPDWKAGIADKKMLPWGVYGPRKPKSFTLTSGSATTTSNTLVSGANAVVLYGGHNRGGGHFVHMDTTATCSFDFPNIKLTDENSNNSGNYTNEYVFGARHMLDTDNKSKKYLWYSPDYKDLIRALPGSLDIFGDTDSVKLTTSWIFSLDEIRVDSQDSDKFYYESGSHVAGDSFTATSGSAKLLSEGIKQFNIPFFGGYDGIDITLVDPFSSNTTEALSGKAVTTSYAYYTIDRTIDILSDKDLLNFDMISMPGLTDNGLQKKLIDMAEDRADTLAIIDLDSGYRKPYENSGTETLGSSTTIISNATTLDYDTSYAAAYYPPVRLRDTIGGNQDVTVVPASVAAVGAIGRSEANSQGPWFAPAGFNRGGIGILGGNSGPRVVGTLEHLTKQNRDDLYEENINPIARFPSIGEIVIFGQKTLQQTPSALDRINVRRLLIYLKKRIGRIANTVLFDQNVQTTWLRFKARADAVLSDVKTRFGLTNYRLVLDETTTTADLIDRNIMYAKIFVQPARSIEFIAIDFVITRTGVEF